MTTMTKDNKLKKRLRPDPIKLPNSWSQIGPTTHRRFVLSGLLVCDVWKSISPEVPWRALVRYGGIYSYVASVWGEDQESLEKAKEEADAIVLRLLKEAIAEESGGGKVEG